ncbi:unnamed protein product [Caenorhabditis angaria]|uniref:Glycosyl hydrolase family 13 catalytic domain-containing protein n=1 Tax=Caenorhabditis angaria TaxID=860376 RepID=A0A9P1N223_9PELO|nr:unnamed protein product [Caenorhabditis angaria]
MATKDALIAEEGNNTGGAAVFDKNAEIVNFEVEPLSIGLTKEQLEKYRNDPFWKPVRTILFALFWIAWIAMFGAAIAIVLLSPKCAEKQKPDWWQTKVSYQVLTATFRDSDGDGVGDFAGITEKIDFLRKIGVTTIYPTPVLQVQKDEYFNSYDVVDHMQVEPRFGTEEQFKELIETAHNRDMYIVMDLPVSTISSSHKWFAEDQDKDLFITAKPGDVGFNSTKFHSFHGSNTLKYLGYPGALNPVLNWKNEKVKQSIQEAIKKYLLLGVDGFHIDHVSQLAVDSVGNTIATDAIQTLKEITTSIREFIANHSELSSKKIVLSSSLQDIENLHSDARQTGLLHYVIDNSFANLNNNLCLQNFSSVANCVHVALDKAYQRHEADSYTPYWQFSNADEPRLASRFDSETANLLSFLQLTLPGALSVYYGQELGLKNGLTKTGTDQQRGIMQWTPKGNDHHGFTNDGGDLFFAETEDTLNQDNFDTQYGLETSPLKVYRKLAKLRQRDEAMIVGDTVRHAILNDVIVFSRYVRASNNTAQGNAYVVALNFGDSQASLDLGTSQYQKLYPSNKNINNVEISVVTTNVTQYAVRQKVDLALEPLILPPKQAILFKL